MTGIRREHRQAVRPVLRLQDLEPERLEPFLEQLPIDRTVVDHERHAAVRHSGCSPIHA